MTKLAYGMVGGGPGAFIGAVHRRAAALDGLAELAAGAFSSDPATSRAFGRELGLEPARCYASWEAMLDGEAARPAGDRIAFVSIVTPNDTHHAIAKACVERGFHVVCEKPMTTTVAEAEELVRLVEERGLVFALTHTYAGYPMVREARALVRRGVLGAVRKVLVEYAQGWLATPLEATGNRQAAWRTDPARAGAGALGDIGTHAEHLARYVTGLEIDELHADVSTMVPGRRVDDDASMLLRFAGGARGVLTCSQVLIGEENAPRLSVHGTEGSLWWSHEAPERLRVRLAGRAEEVLTRGSAGLSREAARASRLPGGHPEGYIEAFANIYAAAVRAMTAHASGEATGALDDYPTVHDGLRSMRFVEAALASGRERAWVRVAPRSSGTMPPITPAAHR